MLRSVRIVQVLTILALVLSLALFTQLAYALDPLIIKVKVNKTEEKLEVYITIKLPNGRLIEIYFDPPDNDSDLIGDPIIGL